ncbi:hypothetical protein CC1G_12267 [Coprinopsis cinerea okayama7|uniref:Uncharacterized protein n=1 Tax=Coprinopsis cinerea (strain Okayama-7 / 130 / ATCC MYA-4618 / FGSC 9003) TaxID=240176 RepID=A8NSW8_COPC7|nr:hypothetical protein CC1G_12267 [Coprinopsis cinerea okayama7\|eukprot:XP_001836108.2 hypothetical protein CC1G_12267 [Coprinopsis cinerea okayama7\
MSAIETTPTYRECKKHYHCISPGCTRRTRKAVSWGKRSIKRHALVHDGSRGIPLRRCPYCPYTATTFMGHAHPADTAMQVDGDCDDEDCDDEDCDADSEGNCDSADEQDGMDYTDDESATQGNLSESLVGNQLYDYDAPEQYGDLQ